MLSSFEEEAASRADGGKSVLSPWELFLRATECDSLADDFVSVIVGVGEDGLFLLAEVGEGRYLG